MFAGFFFGGENWENSGRTPSLGIPRTPHCAAPSCGTYGKVKVPKRKSSGIFFFLFCCLSRSHIEEKIDRGVVGSPTCLYKHGHLRGAENSERARNTRRANADTYPELYGSTSGISVVRDDDGGREKSASLRQSTTSESASIGQKKMGRICNLGVHREST